MTDNNLAMPDAPGRPEDGEHAEYFPDSSSDIAVSGTYQDGLRQGSWKTFFPGGQIQEDCAWDRGLLHGPVSAWAENGRQICAGRYRHGHRVGAWTFWHDNGVLRIESSYDDAGQLHGAHVEHDPDGQLRSRGDFFEGKHHGRWVWRDTDGWERLEKGFHRGYNHGDEAAYRAGGVLAERRGWYFSKRHGIEERFDADGQLIFRGEWRFGYPVGTHTSGDTTETFVDGVPLSLVEDSDKREKLLARLAARPGRAEPRDILRDAIEYPYAAPYLVHLWRQGFDLSADPQLWDMFADAAPLLSGQDVVEFLRQTRPVNEEAGTILPHWPEPFDRLVLDVYPRDPKPIDAALPSLPERIRKGIAFVRGRLGHEIGAVLHDDLPSVVRQYTSNYGPRVWWPEPEGLTLPSDIVDIDNTPTPLFAKLVALFGTQEEWTAEATRAAFEQAAAGELRLSAVRDVVASVAPERIAQLLKGATSGYAPAEIHQALTAWRADDAETTTRIALEVAQGESRDGWAAVAAAILKHRAEGSEPPQELVDALTLSNGDHPSYSFSWHTEPLRELDDKQRAQPAYRVAYLELPIGAASPDRAMLRDALRALSPERARGVVERTLSLEDRWRDAAQYLWLVDDPSVWSQFFDRRIAEGYMSAADWYGLGDLGARMVPLLVASMDRLPDESWRANCGLTILVALCRAVVDDGDFPEEFDRLVDFDGPWEDYDWPHYTPFVERVLWKLPTARAERILRTSLESASRRAFARAFGLVGTAPTKPVLDSAFTGLLRHALDLNPAQLDYVSTGLAAVENAAEWVRWLRRSGGGANLVDVFKKALGADAYQRLDEELVASGCPAVENMDEIDQLRRHAATLGGTERIYLLRRHDGDESTASDNYNVIGGLAPGIDASRWPVSEGEPMTHLFTLDRATMPELPLPGTGEFRTVSVFCLRPDYNEAYVPDNDWTALVYSTENQLGSTGEPPEDVDQLPRWSFEAVAVDVPPAVWKREKDPYDDPYEGEDYDDEDEETEPSPEVQELRRMIYNMPGRVLGEPIWLQYPSGGDEFLMQFDGGFCPMNLGDCGVMYVFDDTAFWQCH